MRQVGLLSLFATLVYSRAPSSKASQNKDLFTSPTLSCEGTLTYTGYVPLQTVTITVDGNYTYTGALNGSLPTAAIFYTPPPPCASIVVPEPSTTINSTSGDSSSGTSAEIASTSTSVSMTTWTQTLTETDCSTILVDTKTTSRTGAHYGNSSTITASEITSCNSTIIFHTYTDVAQTYSALISSESPQPAPAATTHGFVPLIPGSPNPAPVAPPASSAQSNKFGSFAASVPATESAVATVTITKKTPVAAPASNTIPQIAFPGETSGVGSVNNIISRTSTKTPIATLGGANPAAEPTNGGNSSPGAKTSPGGNNSPTGGNATPTGGNNNLMAATKSAVPSNIPTGNSGNNSPGSSPSTASNGNSIGGGGSVGGNNNSPGGSTPIANKNNPTGGSNNSPAAGGDNSPAATTSRGIGGIINSVFNSPFTSVGVSTSYGAASATATLVNGIPIQIQSSSVYIGGSYVALPTGSSVALVTIAGQTFTVEADGIIGGSSTLAIQRPTSVSYSAVQAAILKASTVTQNGVVVTIQPTAAIVSGKTYAIGLNVEATTVTVNGQTITLNSEGVVFASTTYHPAITTAAAYVVSTIGGLTFSIDSSQAIISGTTYRIGAGALNSVATTTIDGTTVIFGPSGIVLPSTTIAPTGVAFTTADNERSGSSGSATVKVVSDATLAATVSGNAATSTAARPPIYSSNLFCAVSMLLTLGTLPLSLLL